MSAENERVVARVSHIPQSPPAEGPAGVKETVALYQDALGLLQQIGAVPAAA
jgi:hypothetical protein